MDSTLVFQALAVIVALFTGCLVAVFGLCKVLLAQFEKRMTERLQAVDNRIAEECRNSARMNSTLSELAQTLPLEYVRREDWIRFSASIDAKLDRLADLVRGGK